MAVETFAWNIQDHLGTAEQQAGYLEAALEDGDPAMIAAALADVAEARGMSAVSLSGPELQLGAVMRAIRALGLRVAVTSEPQPVEPA